MGDKDNAAIDILNVPGRTWPQPWFYGWNVIAVALFAAAASLGIVISSFTFFVMSWMEEFDLSRGETMLALSACQITGGFLFPVAGWLMDRYSIRWIGVTGIACLAGGLVLASLATSAWQILLVYALIFSFADTLSGAMLPKTLAAKWFRAHRGFALAIASMGTAVGSLIFPPVTALLLEPFGWRGTMVILAIGVTVVLVPLLLLIVRNTPQEKGVAPEPERVGKTGEAAAGAVWPTGAILRSAAFWCLVIAFLPMLEITTGLLANLGPYTQDLGISTQSAAILMSLWSMMMIFGKVVFGALSDRLDHRILYAGGLALFSVAMVLLSSEPSYPLLLGTVVILGLASGGQLPLVGAIISARFGPAAFGTVMGLFYLCIRPVALAAPLAGWLRDTFGTYDYLFLGGLVVALLCAPAMLGVMAPSRPSRGRETAG
jgi:MFS family permease